MPLDSYMLWSRRGNGIPLAWGYTRLLEVDWRFITQESPAFTHGECQESMYRARDIFQVSSAVIVTQAFHLPRAIYTARALGIDAVGLKADKHIYAGEKYYDLREIHARLKAFTQVQTRVKPKFLGEVIPVSGDGRLTHDGK